MSLPPPEAELLAEVRRATAKPFVDPVIVQGRPMSRRDARTIERALYHASPRRDPLPKTHATGGADAVLPCGDAASAFVLNLHANTNSEGAR